MLLGRNGTIRLTFFVVNHNGIVVSNDLAGAIPSEIGRLTVLERLFLRKNFVLFSYNGALSALHNDLSID